MRRATGSHTIVDQLVIGLIEGIMTVFGLIVLVFPLALWAVPQHGALANTVFYIVLLAGGGSLISLIALAYLKGLLFPSRLDQDAPMGGKARLEAYKAWGQTQDDARRVEKQIRSMKGGGLHNFGYMVRIATLLSTVVASLYLGTWAFMDFYYGSTEVLSADARWELLHPDAWEWGK